ALGEPGDREQAPLPEERRELVEDGEERDDVPQRDAPLEDEARDLRAVRDEPLHVPALPLPMEHPWCRRRTPAPGGHTVAENRRTARDATAAQCCPSPRRGRRTGRCLARHGEPGPVGRLPGE